VFMAYMGSYLAIRANRYNSSGSCQDV